MMGTRSRSKNSYLIILASGLALSILASHLFHSSPHRFISGLLLISGLGLSFLAIASRASTPVENALSRLTSWVAWKIGVDDRQILFLILGLSFSIAARAASGDGGLSHSPIAVPLWVIGIAFTIIGSWKKEAIPYQEGWETWEFVFLAGLFVFSLGIRAWKADVMPFVLGGDEGSAGLVGIEFLQGTRDNLLTIGWFTFPSFYFWILSVFQGIFGVTVEAIRWSSALAGSLTVVFLYWTARAMFGRRVALWSSLWLSGFHHHIFFSRLAYNNIWDGLFLTIAIGSLWRGWETGRRGFFILAGLAVGFAQFFYTTSHLIPLLLLIWLVPLTRYRSGKGVRFQGVINGALTAASVSLPLGLYYIANPWTLFFTASRVSMLVPGWTDKAAAALGMTTPGLILEQMWVTSLGLLVAEIQGVYYASGVPLLFGLSAVLFVIGFGICIYRIRNPRFNILVLTIAATVIVGGLSIQAPNGQRMLLLPPLLAIIVALPVDAFDREIADRWPRTRRVLPILLTFLIGVSLFQNIEHLFLRYFPEESYGSVNGEVTMEMARILQEEPDDVEVFFVGGDRMGFQSIPSLLYLLPDAVATDLTEPSQISPSLLHPPVKAIFFILPEEIEMRELIEAQYGGGITIPRYNRHGNLLFYQYTVNPD